MIIFAFFVAFVGLCLVVGGDSTAKSIVSLLGNSFVLVLIVLAIYVGFSPLLVGVIGCVSVTFISLFYQNGISDKTVKAAFALFIVLTFAAILGWIMIVYGNMGGFPLGQHEIRETNGYSADIGISIMLVEIAVIMLMLEGALLDTALSISTAMNEVSIHSKDISERELFESGMNIGRDILNSTVNTVFFIFLGQNIILFSFFSNDYTLETFINSKALIEPLFTIVLCAIICVAIIPVTAYICSKKT